MKQNIRDNRPDEAEYTGQQVESGRLYVTTGRVRQERPGQTVTGAGILETRRRTVQERFLRKGWHE